MKTGAVKAQHAKDLILSFRNQISPSWTLKHIIEKKTKHKTKTTPKKLQQ